MPRLAVWLLGTFHVSLDGQPATAFETDKTRSLLAYLMVEAARPHSRERLAGMLWPDHPNASARNSLRQALHNLRHALGDQDSAIPFLLLAPGSVQFNTASDFWLDTVAFGDPLTSCRTHVHTQLERCSICMTRLEEALALYNGDFLAGLKLGNSLAFEEWAAYWREYWHRLALESMVRLSNYYEQSADYEQAWRWATRQLQMEPWREEAHRQLMRSMARLGQRSAALAQYESCRRALVQELGIEPALETRRLYDAIRAGSGGSAGPTIGHTVVLPPEYHAPARSSAAMPWSAFVGRESELAQLERHLTIALAGESRVAFVAGEAGSGKTALIHEFTRRAMLVRPDLIVAHGSCNAQGGIGDPYLPFRDILRMLSGDIEARRAGHSITSEHAGRLWALLPDCVQALVEYGPDLVDTLVPGAPLLQRAQAAALWPEGGTASKAGAASLAELIERRATARGRSSVVQADLFEQVTRVLIVLAARAPLLLVVGDLQWADSGTLALLFHLGRRLGNTRILIMGSYRPDEVALGRAGQRHGLEAIRNEFERQFGALTVDLSPHPGRAFIDLLLDSEPNDLPDSFRAVLERRTEGHPLFTVEMLHGLVERGDLVRDEDGKWNAPKQLDWERVPARVEAIIAERIGSLPHEWQTVLSVGSVEGETFTAETVARVLGQPEETVTAYLGGPLRQQLLVAPESLRRLHNGQRLSRYRFAHALVHQYVYNRLDAIARATGHEAVGIKLEELYREDAATIAVELARHFELAGLTSHAVPYLLEAGNQAMRLVAYREAADHFERGLALLSTLPDTPERTSQELDLRLALAGALTPLQNMTNSTYRYIVAPILPFSQQSGGMQAAHALMFEAIACRDQCEFIRTIEVGEQMLAMARTSGGRQAEVLAHYVLGSTRLFQGETLAARTALETGLDLYNEVEDSRFAVSTGLDVKALMLLWLAPTLWALGYPERALSCAQEAIVLADRLAQPSTLTAVLCGSIWFALYSRTGGDPRSKIETLRQMVDERHLELVRPFAGAAEGWLLIQQGRVESGCSLMRESIAALEHSWGGAALTVVLAENCLRGGLYDEGLKAVDEALIAQEQRIRGHYFECELYRLRGALKLAKGGPGSTEGAEQSFLRAIQNARLGQFRAWELRAAMDLARLWQREGNAQDARQLLHEIYGWFTEGFELPDLREAKDLLEKLMLVKCNEGNEQAQYPIDLSSPLT
jgi:DNA-binding SARP family transcriptional activator